MRGKGGKIAILLGMKPKEDGGMDGDEESPESSDMEGPSPEKVKLFRKMRKAFQAGDDEAGAMAFEALVSMCSDYEEED
jgi:hypothetical protein